MKRLALLALAVIAPAGAHDLTVDVELSRPAVILRASYDGADPASNADVEVRWDGGVFQHASTDANGVFSFVPDQPGGWGVAVDDGFGHREERTLEIDWEGAPTATNPARAPMWMKLLTGLSLIVGLTGVSYGLKSRARG